MTGTSGSRGMVGASAVHIVILTFTGYEISKLLNNLPQIDWFSVVLAVPALFAFAQGIPVRL